MGNIFPQTQTTDCQFASASYQQVSGVYQAGKAKDEVRQSSTEELFGECNQRC